MAPFALSKRTSAAISDVTTFRWLGKNARGERVRGEMHGVSEHDVRRQLSSQGVIVTRLSRKRTLPGMGHRIRGQDMTLFARQMATLIRAGVPLLQSLDSVASGTNRPALRHFVETLKQDVSSGMSFSRALAAHPRHIDPLFVHLIEAGEQAGALDRMLDRVAAHKERLDHLRARVRKAMYYPAAVVAVGIAVTALLLIKVVPQFENMFASFGAELPAPTRMTIALSEAAQSLWWQVLLAASALGWLARRMVKRSPALAFQASRLVLRLPVLGPVIERAAIARFARTLATTFAAGVPLMSALETAGGVCGNLVFEQAIERVRQDVSAGQQLHFAMRTTGLFTPMALQMVAIGEESGSLEAMLNRVADFYDDEVESRVDTLTTLMEPLIIVVLGTLVGGVVVSMYLPVFDLGSAI